MRKFIQATAAAAALATMLSGSPAFAQTTGANPSHEDILRGFDISALYADTSQGTTGFGSGATMTGVVTKWTKPIQYSLNGLMYDKARIAETVAALKRIAALTGVEVREVETGSADANFRIVFRNTENLRTSNGGKAGCLTSWNADQWTGRMNSAEMQINLAYINNISSCIVHELLHAFGLRGHPHKLHSIMSYYTTKIVFDLTEADTVLLQTLYDRRMKAGTPRLAALVLADGITEEKRRNLNPGAPPKSEPDHMLHEIRAILARDAEKGNVRAMLHLIQAYRGGIGAEKNEIKATEWEARAAQQKNPMERFYLAYALANGYYLPKDETRARLLYQENADADHTTSQNNLAMMLRDGKGGPEDKLGALTWLMIAAQKNHTLAERNRQALLPLVSPEWQRQARERAETWKPAQQAAK